MNTTKTLATLSLLLPLTTGGCASIFASGPSSVEVVTESGPQADVTVQATSDNGLDERVTKHLRDSVLQLRRDTNYTLTVSAKGYQEQRVPLHRALEPWLWGDAAPLVPAALCYMYALASSSIPDTPATATSFGGSFTRNFDVGLGQMGGTFFVAVSAVAFGVDFLSSHAWRQAPAEIHADLQKSDGSTSAHD
ncbi:MAG TPA: hypothetical protein V6D47_19835 [Oscillatoriaceae cyanobacterium]